MSKLLLILQITNSATLLLSCCMNDCTQIAADSGPDPPTSRQIRIAIRAALRLCASCGTDHHSDSRVTASGLFRGGSGFRAVPGSLRAQFKQSRPTRL